MKPHLKSKFRRRVARRTNNKADILYFLSVLNLPPATIHNIVESLL